MQSSGESSGSSPRRIVSGVLSSAIGWIVVSVMGAFATHEMAIHYGPSKYSIFVAALAFGSVIENFTDLGLFQVLQRDIARNRSSAEIQMGLTFGLRLTLSALVVPIAIAIAFAIYQHQSFQLRIAVLLVLLALPLAAIQQVVLAYYSATIRLGTAAILGVIKQVTFVFLVAISIVKHFEVSYCVAATLAGSIVSTVASVLLVKREIRLRFVVDLRKWRKMFAETAFVGLTSIIGNFYLNADILLLSVLVSSSELGFYGASYAVISVFQVVPALLSRAILTKIVHTSARELNLTVNNIIVYYAIAGSLIASLAIVGGATVIRLYAGPDFLQAVLPLQILSAGQIFMFMSSALSNISIARGFHQRLFRCSLTGLVVNVALNLIFIPHYGIRGSAVATTVCDIVISLVMTRIVRQDLGVDAHIIRAAWKPILSAAASCAILWHWYSHDTESFLSGIILMATNACLFLSALLLLRGFPAYFPTLIREIIPRKRS